MWDEWKMIHNMELNVIYKDRNVTCENIRRRHAIVRKKRMKKAQSDSFPLGNPSTSCGDKVFDWLISPVQRKDFFEQYWENKPLLVKRNDEAYFSCLISRKMVENYAKTDPDYSSNSLLFTRDNPEGREVISGENLDIDSIQKMIMEDGFCMQAIHPQQKNAKLHALLERLENFTGSVWGSNYYVKCSEVSEGCFNSFSDNVELFIMQMEGSPMRWRVYEGEHKLSRDTGCDFDEDSLGPPILDELVAPGDLVYIPRGCVYTHDDPANGYQYLTLSTYQNQAWCDFLSMAVSETLDTISRSDLEFRRGLPINYLSLFGSAVAETDSNRQARAEFVTRTKSLLHKLIDSISMDEIVDQLASDYIALRTPPIVRKRLNGEETRMFGPDPRIHNDLVIRMRNPNWIRVVVDDTEAKSSTLIFSCLDNQISQHMRTDNPMDCEPTSFELDGNKSVDGLRELISTWPEFSPLDSLSREVAGELWEAGILETCEKTKHQRKNELT
jgi:lysine-specific demethylase/histidyl-hydroxylase NO66